MRPAFQTPFLFAVGVITGAVGTLLAQQQSLALQIPGKVLLAVSIGFALGFGFLAWRESRDRVRPRW